ncbi:hypothetical protein G3M53_72875 [Streptomyces sp. SID7982]|nr:hypothetical protein [Streptomyces sp. SID7982]
MSSRWSIERQGTGRGTLNIPLTSKNEGASTQIQLAAACTQTDNEPMRVMLTRSNGWSESKGVACDGTLILLKAPASGSVQLKPGAPDTAVHWAVLH